MINSELLNKYKNLKFYNNDTLFPVDARIATIEKKCPLCFNKLYEMRNKPFLYCKSTKHKRRFIMKKKL